MSERKIIEWFLRLALCVGFLSAVADRFGLWPKKLSAWGNWSAFVDYTQTLMPFLNRNMANIFAIVATALEIFFAVLLLTNYKTSLVARLSGILLLCFGISMAVFNNIKAPLDYSVFTAAAAAFALSVLYKK